MPLWLGFGPGVMHKASVPVLPVCRETRLSYGKPYTTHGSLLQHRGQRPFRAKSCDFKCLSEALFFFVIQLVGPTKNLGPRDYEEATRVLLNFSSFFYLIHLYAVFTGQVFWSIPSVTGIFCGFLGTITPELHTIFRKKHMINISSDDIIII